ncbi:MAG TPA: FAD-dependent thymidylate synthase [Alphaproteobacteria bacterium]|nr:FAD-dependent thymidylate synthase [Alphaproteobacteria bacterium]
MKVEKNTSETQAHDWSITRPNVEELNNILGRPFEVLDHGFIRVIDYMGDDSAVVQAARVSYGKGTKKTNEDRGLIRYLMSHRHSTPFEMCEIKLHVKLPIFVARQWIRHRTANVNEYSARYSVLDKEFYLPSLENLATQSKINNQGRGDLLDEARSQEVLKLLKEDSLRSYDQYLRLLNQDDAGNKIDEEQEGIARELARMSLPVNYYTQWYWKIDLHNLLHFLALRADPHAQYEIRVYAEKMLEILKLWVPFTYEAFMDYKKGGVHLSSKAWQVVSKRLQGVEINFEQSGLSEREWRELQEMIEG